LIARLPPDHRRITHAGSPPHGIIIRSSPRGVFQHHRPKVDITSSLSVIGLCRWIDVQASTSEPYHARHHRNCYSCSERENGGALEPPPTFCKTVQSKDSRRKIKQQRHQKQRPQYLINLRHLNLLALASDLRAKGGRFPRIEFTRALMFIPENFVI
jgi:hypothetical protein